MKRYLYVLIIVAIVAAAILAGFLLRNRGGTAPSAEKEGVGSQYGGGLPDASQKKPSSGTGAGNEGAALPDGGARSQFGVVAPNPVAGYFVDKQNNLTIVQPDGQIVKISGGKPTTLSSTAVPNLYDASFSADGQKILVTFGTPLALQASVFDVVSKSWQPLPEAVTRPVWAPVGQRIAFLASARGGSAAGGNGASFSNLSILNMSDPKAVPQILTKLHEQDLELDWPNADFIVLSDRGSATYPSSMWKFDLPSRALSVLLEDQYGLTTRWAENLAYGLAFWSTPAGRSGQIALVNAKSVPIIPTPLTFFTIPSKCGFGSAASAKTPTPAPRNATSSAGADAKTSPQAGAAATTTTTAASDFFVCGVPRNGARLNLEPLPDSYQKRAVFTNDDFYRVDLQTGKIDVLFDDAAYALDADNVRIFNAKAFFVNRYDQKLYALSL